VTQEARLPGPVVLITGPGRRTGARWPDAHSLERLLPGPRRPAPTLGDQPRPDRPGRAGGRV